MIKYVKFFICMLSGLLLAQTIHAATIDKIILFGDSLSDNGNIYSLTKAAHSAFPAIPLIPQSPPYFSGRFSNGPIWIDQLSMNMNVPVLDYAYAGSWAEDILESKLTVPFGLSVQVNYFLVSQALDFHKNRHLYIVWTGGNDYISGRDNADYATSKVVNTIYDNVRWLIYYGAKNIVIMNLPDLSIAPLVSHQGADFSARVSRLSQLHNQKIAAMITKLKNEYPDLNIIEGDIFDEFIELITNPAKYNLTNLNTPCYDGSYFLKLNSLQFKAMDIAKEKANIDILNSPSLREAYFNSEAKIAGAKICANPSEYLFWDQLHPTTAAHAIIASTLQDILSQNKIQAG